MVVFSPHQNKKAPFIFMKNVWVNDGTNLEPIKQFI
ncbi:MAG: hypothetical protein JWQ79_1426 [Mucilaginibacter sp.]|nr:hypothetical protein [Mucilaginibacter sp.]